MRRPLQPLDLLNLASVGDVCLHPDGQQVAFTVTKPDIGSDSYTSQIHLHSNSSASQISYGHNDSTLRFSPAGGHLAFVRRIPKQDPEIQILNMASRSIHTVPTSTSAGETALGGDGIVDISWVDEHHLVVLAPARPQTDLSVDDEELGRRPRLLSRAGGLNEGRGWTIDRPNTIEIVTITTGERRLLDPGASGTDGDVLVDFNSIAVSPDGTQILASATRGEDFYLHANTEIHLLAVDGSGSRLVARGRTWDSPGWDHLGRAIASVPSTGEALSLGRAISLDLTAGPDAQPATILCDEGVNLVLPGSSSRGRWSTDQGRFFMANRRGSVTVECLDAEGNLNVAVPHDAVAQDCVVSNFDVTTDGRRVVSAISSPTRPAELWETVDGTTTRLVSLNDDLLDQLDLAPVEIVQVPSTNGAIVEAFVFRPPASVGSGAQHPGLIYIHGGPTSHYTHTFFDEFQIAAAAGYVVIAGNPRGSDGYGDEWAEGLKGNIGTIDFDDIHALSDHLQRLPEVDETRIGIGGGSYGGLMTAWMIGHTDRYQAALVERCVSNMESFTGTSDIGGFFTNALNGTTVELDHAELRRQSPLTYAGAVNTPVLVIHSDSDWRCPLEQGQQLFAAYRRNGVDASMVIFPGENHELSRSGSPKHRMERFGFIHDFYAKHLQGLPVRSDWADQVDA